ncbi:MAG: hypothetical protein K2P74_03060 [Nitrosomonas sp.]|nr:hypothetical protein [Nitrosomonas sp.]
MNFILQSILQYNRTYNYDALNRLISQLENASFLFWGYEVNSNRTNAQFGSVPTYDL